MSSNTMTPRFAGIARCGFFCALRAEALGHVVDARQLVTLGQLDAGYGDVIDAERAVAGFAVEVYVLVVIVLVAVVAQAEFVAHAVTAVLDDMYQVVLTEQRQGSEYTRLVNRQNLVLQLR